MASKPNTSRQHKHFAVLIDADNAPAAIVEGLFEEIAKYGVASVKRICGDWKNLLDHSFQQFKQTFEHAGQASHRPPYNYPGYLILAGYPKNNKPTPHPLPNPQTLTRNLKKQYI